MEGEKRNRNAKKEMEGIFGCKCYRAVFAWCRSVFVCGCRTCFSFAIDFVRLPMDLVISVGLAVWRLYQRVVLMTPLLLLLSLFFIRCIAIFMFIFQTVCLLYIIPYSMAAKVLFHWFFFFRHWFLRNLTGVFPIIAPFELHWIYKSIYNKAVDVCVWAFVFSEMDWVGDAG